MPRTMGDTGRYTFSKQDRSGTSPFMKIWKTFVSHSGTTSPDVFTQTFIYLVPTVLLQIWAWWNYPRSQKEVEERM